MSKLDEILLEKKKEVEFLKNSTKLTGGIAIVRHRFSDAILHPKSDIAIIAEIKLVSPSAGVLGKKEDVASYALAYANAGANCISVVIDQKFFHGDVSFIAQIKKVTSLPVLAKDFIIDKVQFVPIKQKGADAVLIIAKIVKGNIQFFVDEAVRVGLEPIVEVQNTDELKEALTTGLKMIAVNARDLTDFTIDINKACAIIQAIPKDKIALGFSGVTSKEELMLYKKAGVKGVLIGTSFMQSQDKTLFLKGLLS